MKVSEAYQRPVYDFKKKLDYTRGQREETDVLTIKKLIPGCVNVVKTNEALDRLGIDYIATLRGGATLNIDAKTRIPGCSKFWQLDGDGFVVPELALEKWSVIPNEKNQRGRVGWTLDEAKQTDMTLHTFPPSDTLDCYILSFQLLRIAFRENIDLWWSLYKHAPQDSGGWMSECVFVPAPVVLQAITDVSRGRLYQAAKEVISASDITW